VQPLLDVVDPKVCVIEAATEVSCEVLECRDASSCLPINPENPSEETDDEKHDEDESVHLRLLESEGRRVKKEPVPRSQQAANHRE
jgi:hypothetical protein